MDYPTVCGRPEQTSENRDETRSSGWCWLLLRLFMRLRAYEMIGCINF